MMAPISLALRCMLVGMVFGMIVLVDCGGSSDHGNGHCSTITGKILKENGDPAENTKLWLLPDTLNFAADSMTSLRYETHTDRQGEFVFDSIPFGIYCISGKDSWSQGMFALRQLVITSESADMGMISLSIPGTVMLDPDSLGLDSGMVLYFPGLPIFHLIDSAAVQWVHGIPSGVVVLNGYDPGTGRTIDLGIEYRSVQVLSGTTIFVSYRLKAPLFIADSGASAATSLSGQINTQYRFGVAEPGVIPPGEAFRFSWGESDDVSPWRSSLEAVHSWAEPGLYYVQTQMKYRGSCTAWSEPVIVIIRDGN